eukprot:gene22528-9009_t
MANNERQQLTRMLEFIQQGSEETYQSIKNEGDEKKQEEKSKLVQEATDRQTKVFEKSKNDLQVGHRVAKAHHIQDQKKTIWETRKDLINELRECVRRKAKKIVDNQSEYEKLMLQLLFQSILVLKADCTVQCRAEDAAVVNKLIPQ